MATVTIFEYGVIALLLAPLAWLLWFGLDELVRPARPRAHR
jgi:hypothetical protein